MKLKTFLALLPFLFAAVIPFFVACDRFNTVSVPIPTPTPQVLLNSGSAGTWFGNVLTPSSYGGCMANSAVMPIPDSLSGDSNTLQLTTASACGLYIFSSAVTVDPSSYYSKGHLQFDLLLGSSSANYSSINIQYFYSNGTTNASYNLPANLINSLSTTAFTHISIPFSAFTGDYYQFNVDTPFYILWQTSTTGSSISLDDVAWTYN